ncbi:fumarate hydratase C-terminal domain-containing protein [Azohydromonas australica]|uniref:fumarate hydratase C-terminal domain-containing protein n=1 Tax=Azohydromonas australica TaxID=364039 RepID=UPI0004121F00|nr:fumarate hydratase C-terminal domain-containing protein [Azohydromonas australica]
MSITTHRMSFPLSADDARMLRAGDQVIIDGEIVITAGMPTHERMLRCLDSAEPLPMDLQGASLFHLGSFSREVEGRFELLYLNPTTSTRFNPFMPRLIRGMQWHAVGGKGGLDEHCAAAMQEVGSVYLSFLGGGCTLLSQAVKEVVEVGWSDMLVHYRLVRLKVEGLGPVTVGIDAHGRSLYTEEQQDAKARLPELLAKLDAERHQG